MVTKQQIFAGIRPIVWFSERWFILSLVLIVYNFFSKYNKLLAVFCCVMGLVYFVYRYVVWDWVDQYFDV